MKPMIAEKRGTIHTLMENADVTRPEAQITAIHKICHALLESFLQSDIKTPGGRGNPHMKGGMLVVSLKGVNFGFWSHLGCSEQNVIIFSHEGLV